MIIRFTSGKIIISPPLIFTTTHVDEAIDILGETLAAAAI